MKKNNNKIYGRPYQNKPKFTPKKTFKQKIKDNLNKILFWVIITAFCLFTVGSTLGIIAYTKTAKADSVEQTAIYEGNSLMFPTQAFTGSSPQFGTSSGRPFYFSFDYIVSVSPFVVDDIVNNVVTVRFKAVTNANYNYLDGFDYSGDNLPKEDDYVVYTLPYELNNDNLPFNYSMNMKYLNSSGYYANYAQVIFTYDNGFNGNVVSIKIHSLDYTSVLDMVGYYSVRNFITLTDINGKTFSIEVPIVTQSKYMGVSTLMYEDRTYYNSNSFNSNTNFINGKSEGYSDGVRDGEQIGYNKGFADGEDFGYNNGKIDGINQANDYNLYALISTLFNVPITSFIHLINFEFFGVNFANFFTGILTLAVILFIVSKIWGK